ncbi:hypothetical protein DV515_00019457, partial [Chloebia gouldiae]
FRQGWDCPVDCASIYSNGLRQSGIYSVLPSVRGIPVEVLCEMDTEGGGWTVIQRRQDGSVDFNRTWNEYKEGFGDLNGEFWLGNDNIHRMTSQGEYSLRIDLEDWNNKHKHAFYQVFRYSLAENSRDFEPLGDPRAVGIPSREISRPSPVSPSLPTWISSQI